MTAARRLQRLLATLSGLALWLLVVLGGLAAVGRHAWLAELATHFRIQYLGLALLLTVVFLALRRRVLLLLAVTLCAINAWQLAPYWPLPAASDVAGEPQFISLNLYIHNHDHDRVRRYLEERDPQLLVLSELTPDWVRELEPLLSRYPYWVSEGRKSPWGLGVFSRYPLRDAEILSLGVSGSVNVHATVERPEGDLELVAVHLVSPGSPLRRRQRNRQLAMMAELLGPPRQPPAAPRLVLGDMNLTPFSPDFGALLDLTGLTDARRPAGYLGTWPTWMPLLQIPIDHCLADPGLGMLQVRRGPRVGSDHYPLEITLASGG